MILILLSYVIPYRMNVEIQRLRSRVEILIYDF